MLQYEIKKLYIKQHFLLVVIMLIALKAVSLFFIQQPAKADFTPQDKPIFISLVDELGGQITQESEKRVNDALNSLYEAEKSAIQLRSRILAGKYDTTSSYAKEYAELLPVLQQKAALAALNEEYLYASKNPENRWILSATLPLMETHTVDFILLVLILLLPVMVYYQEDKTGVAMIIKSNHQGSKRTAYAKMAIIVFSTVAICSIFFLLEYLHCMATLQKGEMSAPLQSLRFFSDSRYDITIVEAFWGISGIKLVGYIFLALLGSTIVVKSKTQIAPILVLLGIYIIEPFAIANKNIIYNTPFSLIKASGFFRGNEQVIVDKGMTTQTTVPDFTAISSTQLFIVMLTGIAVIIIAGLICYRTYCTRKKHIKVMLMLCIPLCLFSGCSAQSDVQANTVNLCNSDALVQNDTSYFFQEGSSIQMIDKATGKQEDILRTPFLSEDTTIKAIFCTNEYLYYLISTPMSNNIYQIDLDNFGQKTILSQQLSDVEAFLGLSRKDISLGISSIEKILIYDDELYFITSDYDSLYHYSIPSKRVEKVISDGIFNGNLSVMNQKIYYINAMLELKCYDLQSQSNVGVSDISCRSLYACEGHLFVSSSQGIFCIDVSSGTTKKLSDMVADGVEFDGENLLYANQQGVIFAVNPDGKEEVYN